MAVEISSRRRGLIFVNVVLACIATSMLATAMSVALPDVIKDFSIDVTLGQWVTSGYSLAMAITMPLTAFLITRFPTKPLYLTGLVASIAGIVLCAVAPTFAVLMAARMLQAFGNGLLTAMAQVILLTIYPPEKRGSVMGWYGLSVSAAPVVAPTIAGLIIDAFSWRVIFWAVLPFVAVALIWALVVFGNVLETHKKRFDVLSFVLSGIAFAGVTLGVGSIGDGFSSAVMAELALGIAAGVAFTVRQLRLSEPFLDVRTFASRDFSLSVIGSMMLYFVMMGSSTIMPLYVQSILGKSAVTSAFVMMPGSIAMAVISPFAGRMYDAFGMKPLFIGGAALLLASNVGMVFVTAETALWVPTAWNAVRCVSIGCLMMPLLTWGTASLPDAQTAHASALLTSLRTVAGAVGTAVFVGILNAVAGGSLLPERMAEGMAGMGATFTCMSVASVVLLAIAVFFVRSRKRVLR